MTLAPPLAHRMGRLWRRLPIAAPGRSIPTPALQHSQKSPVVALSLRLNRSRRGFSFHGSGPATCHRPGPGPTVEESNMYETNQSGWLGQVDHGSFSQFQTLREMQQGESWVYAILCREGAIKIGISTNLAERKRGIKFGGPRKIMGFIPGDITMERDVQASLEEFRIYGTREYFYPRKPVLAKANWMRAYWGVEPLPSHYLPHLSDCTFHRRVMEAEARGESVFTGESRPYVRTRR